LSRDIDVTDSEVNQINKRLDTLESASAVFHQADDSIQTFSNGVRESRLDEGDDVFSVVFDGTNELADRFQSTLECRGAPVLQEASCCPWCFVVPEQFELVFQDAGTMNPTVALAESVEDVLVLLGAVRWVLEEEPPKALESTSLGACGVAPLFLSHLVHYVVERFDNVKTVQYEFGIRAVVFDSPDEGFTHVAAGPLDLLPLVVAEHLVEELVDGVALLALSDPEHAGTFEVVDNGDVFVPLVVGDLIHADGLESPDPVSISYASNGPMEYVGKRRAGNAEELSSCFLGHQLGVDQYQELKAIGDACIRIRPGDVFLDTTVDRAHDFLWAVKENHRPATHADVTPFSGLLHDALDLASPSTFGTPASILVRLDEQAEFFQSALEPEANYFQSFQFE